MGGIGSGRGAVDTSPRDYVDSTASLGVADLWDNDVLPSGGPARWEQRSAGATLYVVAYVLNGKVVITVAHAGPDGRPRTAEATVTLSWSDCHYGGRRAWLLCPAWDGPAPCERRVADLYLTAQGLMCRHCAGLGYRSDHAQPWLSPLSRARKILRSLGGSGDLAEEFPPRPRGMHDVTYRRLYREVCQCLGLPAPRPPGACPSPKAGRGRKRGGRPPVESPAPGDGASAG